MIPTNIILGCLCAVFAIVCFYRHLLYCRAEDKIFNLSCDLDEARIENNKLTEAIARVSLQKAKIVNHAFGTLCWYEVQLMYQGVSVAVRTFAYDNLSDDDRQWALQQAEELCDNLNECLLDK